MTMHTALMVLLAIDSIFLIATVLLQPGSSDGLSGSIAGGAEQLFGKKKSSAYEVLLKRCTVIGAIAFIVLALIIVTLY